MRFMRIAGSAWVVAGLTMGCADSPQEVGLGICETASSTVRVFEGPTFRWSPSCGVHLLRVIETRTGAVVWELSGYPKGASNPLLPGIRYGVRPDVALEVTAPAPLEPGRAYRIQTFRREGPPDYPVIVREVGAASFEP